MGEAIGALLIPPARGPGAPGAAAPARPSSGGQGFASLVDGPVAAPDGAPRVAEEIAEAVDG